MPNSTAIEEAKEVLVTFVQSDAGKKLMAGLGESGKYLLVTYLEEGLGREIGFLTSSGWRSGIHPPDQANLQGTDHFAEGDDAVQQIAEQMAKAAVLQWTSIKQAGVWLNQVTAGRDGFTIGTFPPLDP